MNNFVRTADCAGRISVSVTAKDGGNAGFAGAKTCPSDVLVGLGVVL